jgi:dihydrofolate synthase/folylpolyglutamate synthase
VGLDAHPTFFEVLTVMALRYFAEQTCELVIWETGMGGRLDATNIVTPLASVITNIGFDHQQWLGETLAKIAHEKVGIIKPGVPVITTTDVPEALVVIEETAKNLKAPLTKAGQASSLSRAGETTALPLPGEHQRLNATLAVATVRTIRDRIPVSDDNIRCGLETVQWPGRMQLVKAGQGQSILLDGAHNAGGAEAFRTAFLDLFPDARPTFILGMLQDKDWAQMCGILAPLARRILLTPVSSDRTAPPEPLRDACCKINPRVETIACPSLADALNQAANDPFVVITGSLYLVGEAMELLKLSPPGATSERGLNEWTLKQ